MRSSYFLSEHSETHHFFNSFYFIIFSDPHKYLQNYESTFVMWCINCRYFRLIISRIHLICFRFCLLRRLCQLSTVCEETNTITLFSAPKILKLHIFLLDTDARSLNTMFLTVNISILIKNRILNNTIILQLIFSHRHRFNIGPVGWGCRIYWLHLCKRERLSQRVFCGSVSWGSRTHRLLLYRG